MAKSGDRGMTVVEDIIRTNAFGLTINGRGYKGLYPEIAVSGRPDILSTGMGISNWDPIAEIQPWLCTKVGLSGQAEAARG